MWFQTDDPDVLTETLIIRTKLQTKLSSEEEQEVVEEEEGVEVQTIKSKQRLSSSCRLCVITGNRDMKKKQRVSAHLHS